MRTTHYRDETTMIIADDLFAGAGGWDVGALRLGIHARGIENMKQARATRDAAGLETIHDDVWTFEPDAAARGLIASPPCQTFSAAGKGSGRKALDQVLTLLPEVAHMDLDELRSHGDLLGDDRTALVLTPLWFALHHDQYEWLAWEQVPTVLPVWEACAIELRSHGWSVWTGNLQAEMYGVPQTRKRAVLIASRTREVSAPKPTHSRYYSRNPEKLDEGVEKWVSMAEALGWCPDECRCGWGQRRNSGPGAERRPRSVDEPAYTIRGQGSGSHPCGVELAPSAQNERPEWCYRRPSTTIVGSFKPEIVAAPGYRTTVSRQNAEGSVRVTVEEAGVLQSFPADFPWQGAKGKQFLQCGNAVPPLLAAHVLAEAAGLPAPEFEEAPSE